MTKGKVVLVPFPFDDLTTSRVRPAVCLTDPVGPYRHVIVAFISSQIPLDLLETDLLLEAHHPEFAQTGLKVSSVLRLHRLMTISTTIIRRELGQLSPEMQRAVEERLRKLFKLP
uniref:Plasmid maintenance toxin/cell growth inhibitor n=1 Tax=Acetithermum autotrophicum TaxID=1446466 RepID=H5SV60_ACEAU|nr:plasmid maintenance toxin/cell growth inhibitor [Candidatus Acetothermum autotrophicum]